MRWVKSTMRWLRMEHLAPWSAGFSRPLSWPSIRAREVDAPLPAPSLLDLGLVPLGPFPHAGHEVEQRADRRVHQRGPRDADAPLGGLGTSVADDDLGRQAFGSRDLDDFDLAAIVDRGRGACAGAHGAKRG